jgi:hypothetical protein
LSLGACPRIATVASARGFEFHFLIIIRRIVVLFNENEREMGPKNFVRTTAWMQKVGQRRSSCRVGLSVLGQAPRLPIATFDETRLHLLEDTMATDLQTILKKAKEEVKKRHSCWSPYSLTVFLTLLLAVLLVTGNDHASNR